MPESAGDAGGPIPPRVRPYVATGGRTRAAVELGLETLLSVPEPGSEPAEFATAGHRAIWRLADATARPLSLAEIAAHRQLPLGVARILVTDLITAGLLHAHPTSRAEPGLDRPSQQFLQRVLDGLHRL